MAGLPSRARVRCGRNRWPSTTAPDVLARGRIEAMVARGVDALPGVHELSVMTVPEVGDRSPGDTATYPNDDIRAASSEDGKRIFTHKDGTPY